MKAALREVISSKSNSTYLATDFLSSASAYIKLTQTTARINQRHAFVLYSLKAEA